MKFNSARVWPYAIGGSIVMVFGFCVATVVVTTSADIQESNAYMSNYHVADAIANDIINNRIAFDKKYRVEFVDQPMKESGSVVRYRVTDLHSKIVENAKIKIVVSRPETHKFDQKLDDPEFKNGVYSFSDVKFQKQGVWDIIAKIEVGQDSRFQNIKADTRYTTSTEY
jgi:nitrogen fixation protein FixH